MDDGDHCVVRPDPTHASMYFVTNIHTGSAAVRRTRSTSRQRTWISLVWQVWRRYQMVTSLSLAIQSSATCRSQCLGQSEAQTVRLYLFRIVAVMRIVVSINPPNVHLLMLLRTLYIRTPCTEIPKLNRHGCTYLLHVDLACLALNVILTFLIIDSLDLQVVSLGIQGHLRQATMMENIFIVGHPEETCC